METLVWKQAVPSLEETDYTYMHGRRAFKLVQFLIRISSETTTGLWIRSGW